MINANIWGSSDIAEVIDRLIAEAVEDMEEVELENERLKRLLEENGIDY